MTKNNNHNTRHHTIKTNAGTLEPVNEDFIAHSYLKGIIDRDWVFRSRKSIMKPANISSIGPRMNISRWFQMDARANARRNIMPAIHPRLTLLWTILNPSQFLLHSTLAFGRKQYSPMGRYNYGYFAAFVGSRQTTLECLRNGLFLNIFRVTLESILIPREVPQLPIQSGF